MKGSLFRWIKKTSLSAHIPSQSGIVIDSSGTMKVMRYLILFIVLASCATQKASLAESKARDRMNSLDQDTQNNINALLEMIEEQALVITPDEKRYIPYEFRIPLDSTKKKQVIRIDPSVTFTARADMYQCIGENATKEKVFQIIALPYTYKIKFCPYE